MDHHRSGTVQEVLVTHHRAAHPPRARSSQQELRDELGESVYATGSVVIATTSGPVLCLPAVVRQSSLDSDVGGGGAVVRLTAREAECLGLVAEGRTGASVAELLGLAPNTVAQHLVAVRRKYGVRTTEQAVRQAISDGTI